MRSHKTEVNLVLENTDKLILKLLQRSIEILPVFQNNKIRIVIFSNNQPQTKPVHNITINYNQSNLSKKKQIFSFVYVFILNLKMTSHARQI